MKIDLGEFTSNRIAYDSLEGNGLYLSKEVPSTVIIRVSSIVFNKTMGIDIQLDELESVYEDIL